MLEGASSPEMAIAIAEGRSIDMGAAIKHALNLPEEQEL